MKKITKKSKLIEVISSKPEAMEILTKHGMHCVGCALAHFETLEDGCKAHGIDDKEITKIVKEINTKKSKKK